VERKVATVLFADLVGSTELGEQDPELVRQLLERFYAAMAEEVEHAAGTVEKFAGDAIMAAFGAPAAYEDHAERALHAALGMRARLRDVSDRLELRIGVNTGEVVVNADATSSFVTGDAVNICARLEQNAEPGEIVVGERTAHAARGAFEFGPSSRVQVRGKPEGVVCRRLIRALSLMRPRGVSGLPGEFVGRLAELRALQAEYRRAVETARARLVAIVGDAGVGKTRLARELWAWLSVQPEKPLRRVGRCLAYGEGTTYWPIREIIQEHLGLTENDPPEIVRARLGERQILGLVLGLEPEEDLHPLAARDRLRDGWVEFVEALVRQQPVVLLLEDVHWADEPLLELIERTARDVHGPLLVLATLRPERDWTGGRANTATIELEPLGADSITAMLAGMPAEVRDLVVARSEGNPFFVEELIGSLIDHGHLERNGGWRAGPLPPETSIPDSVQGVLAARIDLLPPREKEALQAAALIGRVFWDGPVRKLIGHDADLALLEERDFVRRRPGSSLSGELEYAIKHALTREVAYASIPKARRARMHAAFGRWLEKLETRDELASLLAHHFSQAVRAEDVLLAWEGSPADLTALRRDAVHWLRRAAEAGLSRYEIDDARVLLHRALELAEDDEQRVDLWRLIGKSHALEYDGPGFWTAMEKAIALSRDSRTLAELHSRLALDTVNRSGMWKQRPSREVVERAVDRALELSEPETPARARALVARVFLDAADAGELAREASELAERLGDPGLRSLAWDARADVALAAGDYSQALTWGQRRYELLGDMTDPNQIAYIHLGTLRPAVVLGRFEEGRRLARLYEQTVRPLTPHHRMHGVSLNVEVETLAGEWATVAALQPRVERAVEENLATPCARNSLSLLLCAAANAKVGERAAAWVLGERAEALGLEGFDDILDPARIRLALALGELERVQGLLARSPSALRRGSGWFSLVGTPARLDALAAVGDRITLEEEAELFVRPGTCFEPYALRALGIARRDVKLLELARKRFQELGLGWQARETGALVVAGAPKAGGL
jgi:class 3 adenylate cyclase